MGEKMNKCEATEVLFRLLPLILPVYLYKTPRTPPMIDTNDILGRYQLRTRAFLLLDVHIDLYYPYSLVFHFPTHLPHLEL